MCLRQILLVIKLPNFKQDQSLGYPESHRYWKMGTITNSSDMAVKLYYSGVPLRSSADRKLKLAGVLGNLWIVNFTNAVINNELYKHVHRATS